MPGGRAKQVRICRETVLRLRHTNRIVTVAFFLELFELVTHFLVGNNLVRAIYFTCNSCGFVPQAEVIVVQSSKLSRVAIAKFHDMGSELGCALATIGPMGTVDRMYAEVFAIRSDHLSFCVGVCCETVNTNDQRHAELTEVTDVAAKVLTTFSQRLGIFDRELIFRYATVHLEGLDRCD